jgi:hypothetical protein
MNSKGVINQIRDFTERLLRVSLCTQQFPPSVRTVAGGAVRVGLGSSQSIAMKDVSYDDVYNELDRNQDYHIKLVDGGLLTFQYSFDPEDNLSEHRLTYFPCPTLPSIDDAPALYHEDEPYGDITAKRIVRFPVRFDYTPVAHRDVVHPASHLTLGQYANCRIPVAGPLGPVSFGMFVLRNFYNQAYTRHKNLFDKKPQNLLRVESISGAERRITHIVNGW